MPSARTHPATYRFSIEQITAAAETLIYPVMPPTPQYVWPLLSARAGGEVWVKHENHTPVGAFKVRGGLVWVGRRASELVSGPGLIAATRGNHGQSFAFAARRHGVAVTMVVPGDNSKEKNAAMRALGAQLIVHGDDFDAALAHARRLADERGLTFAPSLHPDLSLGIASYALELFHGAGPLAAVYVPIGQGSGIAAVIAARDALGLRTEVVGAVSARYPAYAESVRAGHPVTTPPGATTIADGVACRTPNPEGLAVIRDGAARVVVVAEDDIRAAMRHYFTDTHQVAEGAGAVALAALLADRARPGGPQGPVAVVLSGGNVDRDLFAGVLAE